MNNRIIHARFMHQYKGKAVYEREILLETPSINQYYGEPTTYLEFEMPLLLEIEPEFVRRWLNNFVKTYRNTHVTRRSLRFVDSDGTILYELSERPIKANLCVTGRELSSIHICCTVEKDEIKEMTKFFFK